MRVALGVVRNVLADMALAGVLYLGFHLGYGWAVNVGLFGLWFFAVMGIAAGIAWHEEGPGSPERWRFEVPRLRSRLWRTYYIATDTGFVLWMAALGYFVTAAAFALGSVLSKASLYEWSDKVSLDE